MAGGTNLSKILGGPILVAIILSFFALFWLKTSAYVKEIVNKKTAALEERGYDISHEIESIRGFPIKAQVNFSSLTVKMPSEQGNVVWKTKDFSAERAVFGAPKTIFRFGGDHTFSPPDSEQKFAAKVNAGASTLMQNPEGETIRYSLNMTDADLQTPLGPVKSGNISAHLDLSRLSDPSFQDTTHTLTINADDITLPKTKKIPLGEELKNLKLKARVLGPLDEEKKFLNAVEKWRKDGGVVEVDKLYLNWPPPEMGGNGTLALNSNFAPIGALTVSSIGFLRSLNSFVDAGMVPSSRASVAKVVLGSQARSTESGRADVGFSLSFQNSKILADSLPLITLPPFGFKKSEVFGVPQLVPGFSIDEKGKIVPDKTPQAPAMPQ